MLLAIDLGTKLGWATNSNIGQYSGVQDFKNDRFSGGGMRYLKFEKWLNTMEKPTQVVFEEVHRHAGTAAAHVYGGLMAVLMKWCEDNAIPYTGVGVGTIKKHWTGKGNANKNLMTKKCIERGYKPADDNEADAIALRDYWITNFELETETLEDLMK